MTQESLPPGTFLVEDDILEIYDSIGKTKGSLKGWIEGCVRWAISAGGHRSAHLFLARANSRGAKNLTLDGLALHRKDGDYLGADIFCWNCGARGMYMKVAPPDLWDAIYYCPHCGKVYRIEERGVDGRSLEP